MSKVENQFGKQHPKDSKLGTENPKTHDAKPKTQDPVPETLEPRGPKNSFVSSFASWVLPQEFLGELVESRRNQSEPNSLFWSSVLGLESCGFTNHFILKSSSLVVPLLSSSTPHHSPSLLIHTTHSLAYEYTSSSSAD